MLRALLFLCIYLSTGIRNCCLVMTINRSSCATAAHFLLINRRRQIKDVATTTTTSSSLYRSVRCRRCKTQITICQRSIVTILVVLIHAIGTSFYNDSHSHYRHCSMDDACTLDRTTTAWFVTSYCVHSVYTYHNSNNNCCGIDSTFHNRNRHTPPITQRGYNPNNSCSGRSIRSKQEIRRASMLSTRFMMIMTPQQSPPSPP